MSGKQYQSAFFQDLLTKQDKQNTDNAEMITKLSELTMDSQNTVAKLTENVTETTKVLNAILKGDGYLVARSTSSIDSIKFSEDKILAFRQEQTSKTLFEYVAIIEGSLYINIDDITCQNINNGEDSIIISVKKNGTEVNSKTLAEVNSYPTETTHSNTAFTVTDVKPKDIISVTMQCISTWENWDVQGYSIRYDYVDTANGYLKP